MIPVGRSRGSVETYSCIHFRRRVAEKRENDIEHALGDFLASEE